MLNFVSGLVPRRRFATPYISVTPFGRGDAQSVLTLYRFTYYSFSLSNNRTAFLGHYERDRKQ